MVIVTVSDPQTETEGRKQQQKFTSYMVTTISEETSNKNQIRRRYSDFTWLYSRLETEVPGAIIPIIPHERALFSDQKRLSDEFVERRRRDLQDFLAVVISHPELSRAPSMTPFMLDKMGVEFTKGKKRVEDEFPTFVVVDDEQTKAPQSKAGAALMGVSNMLARVFTPKDQLKDTPEEKDIGHIKDYVSKVDSHVRPLVKAAETMTRLTGELAVTIGDITNPVGEWQTTYESKELTGHQRLAQINGTNPAYTDSSKAAVVDMMSSIQEFSKDYSTLLLMKHKQEEESFERSIQGLQNHVRAIQRALKQRKHWQVAYTTTYQYVIDKEAAIAKATKSLKPPEVTGKLQDEKAVLEKRKVLEKERLFQCSSRVVKEFEQHQPKLEEALRAAFFDYATLQRSYTDRINDAWGQLLPFVQPPKLESQQNDNKEDDDGTNGKNDDDNDNDSNDGEEGEFVNNNNDNKNEVDKEDDKIDSKEVQKEEEEEGNKATDNDDEKTPTTTENGESSRPTMPSEAPLLPPTSP